MKSKPWSLFWGILAFLPLLCRGALPLLLLTLNLSAEDEPGGDTTSGTKSELEMQLEEMKQRLELLTARRDAVRLYIPEIPERSGSVKAEGDIAVESQIIAYEALEKIACALAQRLPRGEIVVYDPSDLASMSQLKAFEVQLDRIDEAYGAVPKELQELSSDAVKRRQQIIDYLRESTKEGAVAAAPLISGALGVFGLFRDDTTVASKTFTASEEAFVAELAAAGRSGPCAGNKPTIRYSASTPLGVLNAASPMVKRLDELSETHRLRGKTLEYLQVARDQRSKLRTLMGELEKLVKSGAPQNEIDAKNKEIKDVQDAIGDNPSQFQLPKELAILERDILTVKIARALHSLVEDQILASKDAAGLTLLARLLRAEKLREWINGGHVLQVKIVAAGGSVKTASNFFRTKIEHSGGAVVSFLLYNDKGDIEDSDTLRLRADHRSFKNSQWGETPQ